MSSIPNQPTNPEPIQPPVIELAQAPALEPPMEFLKRSKAVAKTIKKFLRQNPTQQLKLDGKKYPRVETWQFAAACFGYTAMVTSTEEIISEDGKELGFVSTAHTINSQGRVISGAEAACMHSETDWQGKPSFQLRSMAQTRSTAKTLRNVLAFVMVQAGLCGTPAEEMENRKEQRRDFTTPCFECGGKVSDKRREKMRKKYGRELCINCEKKELEKQGDKILAPINKPEFVAESVAKVQAQRAQPIVAAMDAGEREYA
jgi:hypothetical protein